MGSYSTSEPTAKIPSEDKKFDKEYIKNLDSADVTFPVGQKDYRKVEIRNNINIDVFGYEKQEPYPVYEKREIQ